MSREWRPDVSRHHQIADELRAQIRSGELPPGAKIPGENGLIDMYGVSRDTARKALAVLRGEGLTETKKGSGTIVRSFKRIPRNSPQRTSHEQWGRDRAIHDNDLPGRAEVQDVVVDRASAPDHIAEALGLQPGTEVCRRDRRYAVEGRPVQLATSYLPLDLVEGTRIMEVDTGAGGTYRRLEELGHAPVHFREVLRGRMPLPEETERLELPEGTPVLDITRYARDEAGRMVEVNEMTLDASSYVLGYDFPA